MRKAGLMLALLSGLFGYGQADFCGNAVSITPGLTNCNPTAGSSANATQSYPSCSGGGNADDDVWYQFVANSSTMTIEVDPTVGYDPVIQLYAGSCGSSSIQCQDVNGNNGDEVLVANGLTPGNTYYFRVYHYGIGSGTSTFNVCVYGLAPANNNTPCSAYSLPSVNPSCNFQTFTNSGSAGSAVPAPTGCGGSSPFQGGYAGGDAWFKVVVPASGMLDIHTQSIDFSDGAMAIYNGTCSSPNLISCNDDSGPGLMPYIFASGLTPGDTVYIRVWEYGNNANGQFGICVSSPDNDNCADAQEICDLNGYGGVTSSAYTIDQPDNMCGIGDPNSPNPGCVFGTGYTGASPVQIDNNSWLKFTASSTTAELFVNIMDCANGNGMQMQIFEGTNCTNFTAVSNFLETTTSQTVLATGLTPGNTYYIVVDGFAGDICSYEISATSGVQVVEAVAVDDEICLGDNTQINAVVTGTGSYGYEWFDDSGNSLGTTSPITVSPTANNSYTVEVTGLCGATATASVFITVHDLPTANAGADATICEGQSTTLNGSGGTSFDWNNGAQDIANPTVSPGNTTTYTLEVTDANGCTDTDDVQVTVNPNPIANAGTDQTICAGQSVNLSGSGGGTYSWNQGLGSGQNQSISPGTTTTYTLTVTNGFNCTDQDQVTVNVNPLPNANAGNDITICNGGTTQLNATGGVNYDWDDPSLTDVANPTVGPLFSDQTYTVTVTDANNCVNTDQITVFVGAALIPDAGADASICLNDPLQYTASGGNNYVWTDENNTVVSSSASYNPPTNSVGTFEYYLEATSGSCSGNDTVIVTVNQLPTAAINPISSLCAGDSVELIASGGTSYSWDQGLGAGQSQWIQPNTGTSNYTVTVTDANGCEDTESIQVLVNALPVILASADQEICEGQTANISASSNNGGTVFTWNNGVGTGANQNVSPNQTTMYVVVGVDANMCENSDSVLITVNNLPVIDTSSMQVEDADCVNGGGTISGISFIGNGAFSPVWTENGIQIGNTTSIGSLTQGSYTLTVTDINGCESQVDINVGFIDLSSLNANNDSTSAFPNTPTSINAYINDTGDINTITIITPPVNGMATYNGNGMFTYTSNNGFMGIDSLVYEICDAICPDACERATIYFWINDKSPVDVPNGFTPNGDGHNDYFVILNLEQYPENELLIYNRWGDPVYQAAPYNNDWDGSTANDKLTLRGNKVVDGTYFFVLKLGEGYEPINGFVELRTK